MDKDIYPGIAHAQAFTQETLTRLRERLEKTLKGTPYAEAITLVATGSYGRGEATPESDLDWFIIFDRDQPAEVIANEISQITAVIKEVVPINAGDTGTFGEDAIVHFSDMQSNIGGKNDTNETLTRRLLFLLEGTWLYSEERFNQYRRQLLEKYIKPTSPDRQIPRFLLNDIIRYYRTIATDFEYKTSEGNKEWGLRNIKLRFSRKLIYFSGIVVAAELPNLSWHEKVAKALALFNQPVLKRITSLGAEVEATTIILEAYESFTQQIANPAIRQKLEEVEKEKRHECPEYMKLKDAADDFSKALHCWLVQKYSEDDLIHHALVF